MSFHEYPYTNFHEMNLDWVVKKVKELAAAWAQVQQDWTDEQAAFANLQSWIENYFNNLDVQTEINVKLDAMVAAGTMSELIAPYVASGLPAEVAEQIGDVVAAQIGPVVAAQIGAVVADELPAVAAAAAAQEVSAWLALHVNPETGYVIDDTFTVQGAAADAKAVGDEFTAIKSALSEVNDYVGYYKEITLGGTGGVILYADGSKDTTTPERVAAYKFTDFIQVAKGETIEYKTLSNSYIAVIAFYSSADVSSYVQENSVAGTQDTDIHTYTVPDDGYVIITNRNDTVGKYAVINLDGLVSNNIQPLIDGVKSSNAGEQPIFASVDGYFLKSDGTVQSSDTWFLKIFKVLPSSKIAIKTFMNVIGSAATPKKAYVFLNRINHDNTWNAGDVVGGGEAYVGTPYMEVDERISVPNNAYYLVVCIGSTGINEGFSVKVLPFSSADCVVSNNLYSLIPHADSYAMRVCTIDESFTYIPNVPHNMPLVMSISAKYSGSDKPYVRFRYYNFYTSPYYEIGDTSYKKTELRIPPYLDAPLEIDFTIPSGTTLYVNDFSIVPQTAKTNYCGVRFDAHLGFQGFAPENTIPSFEYAAICGFEACIVVPKVTRDGVIVCIHDDSINRTAMNADGTSISETINVEDTDYADLLNYDYSKGRNAYWRGCKIPTVEEFFMICAKTGMKPMFSVHPDLTTEQWEDVKLLLKKYGLLKQFTFKSFNYLVLDHGYSVFGSEIEGYIADSIALATMLTTEVNNATCRKVIENEFDNWTAQDASAIMAEGYECSAWNVGIRHAYEYETLIKMGVHEYCEDYHCSSGLDW